MQDGGDAELRRGLVFADGPSGLQVDVRIRRLVMHEVDGFAERGFSVAVSYDPQPSTPLGLRASVASLARRRAKRPRCPRGRPTRCGRPATSSAPATGSTCSSVTGPISLGRKRAERTNSHRDERSSETERLLATIAIAPPALSFRGERRQRHRVSLSL